jgi:hypothetical protein
LTEAEEQAKGEQQKRYQRAMAKYVRESASDSIEQYMRRKEELRLKALYLHDSQRQASTPFSAWLAAKTKSVEEAEPSEETAPV